MGEGYGEGAGVAGCRRGHLPGAMKEEPGLQENRRESQRAGGLVPDPVTVGSRVPLRRESQCAWRTEREGGMEVGAQRGLRSGREAPGRVPDEGLHPDCH